MTTYTGPKKPHSGVTLPLGSPAARPPEGQGAAGPDFVSAYSPKLKVQLFCDPEQDKTKQSFKDECDINHIMKRVNATGVLQHQALGQPRYIDATGWDFQTSMEIIANARSLFESLPAEIRLEFQNDPRRFLEFADNPANAARLAQMGVERKRPGGSGGDSAPPPSAAPAASPAAAAAPAEAGSPPAKAGG